MSSKITDGTDLPPELITKPLALIGLTGLDTVNNAVHKLIWDAFGNNHRPDRAVHFKLLPNDHKFPQIKPKRNSYEWYKPKGILKKNWLNKHLNLIPAVIVVFYDMDWNDIQWNEKVIECASRVQSMRAVTSMHSPKIVVVVIQNTAPNPSSEDTVLSERAQTLCTACDIQAKLLFVLPYVDHLLDYAILLENAFYDLAQQYYHQEIRNIKIHRDHLTKTTHQYLFVRHQFKIGFINELKQDFSTAQRHYLNAYTNLLEVPVNDVNILEVKTVAGYINYKLCHLLFSLKQPRDAINQMRTHIERYAEQIGIRELVFEHYAWMTRQYGTFGDLFNDAIRNGLTVNQTQHPGFYYQQAAHCATKRRVACQDLCSEATDYPQPDPLQGKFDYYDQHAYIRKEKDALKALQYNELQISHSMIIIKYLELAIKQFKTYRCPRMKRHLLVQMAQEYYTCGEYGKALVLLTHILVDYRKEKWWFIVSLILNQALACAYLTASVQDYVKLAIEALGKNINIQGDKKRIFDNLLTVLNSGIPQSEPNIPISLLSETTKNWKSSMDNEVQSIVVEMSTLSSCIEAKARFTDTKYQVDSWVQIEVFIRINTPAALQLEKVTVQVNNNDLVVCEKETTPSLLFEDGTVRRFIHKFVPEPQDVGRNLQISSISLQLGESNTRHAILLFTGAGVTTSEIYPEIFHYRSTIKEIPNFDSIQPLVVAQITPRESKMSVIIQQDDPALLGEWFPIIINLTNDELTDAHHIKLSLNLLSLDPTNLEPPADLCFDIGEVIPQLPLILSVGTLNSQSVFKKIFYLRSNKVLSTNILMKITYDITTNGENKNETSDKKKMACFKEHSIKVTVVKPFEISSSFLTMYFKDIEKCFNQDPFIVMPHVKILSPWPLLIEDTLFETAECFEKLNIDSPSCIKGLVVKENVKTNEALCVKSKKCPSDQPVNLGLYTVYWKRMSSELSTISKTSVMLAAPQIASSWLRIETILPAHGYLRCPLPFKLRFHSTALQPHSLLLRVEASDAFMFSGHKQYTINILPDTMREFAFNLYPLACGAVTPPRFHLSPIDNIIDPTSMLPTSDVMLEYLKELIDRNVPNRIYIMPQEKSES